MMATLRALKQAVKSACDRCRDIVAGITHLTNQIDAEISATNWNNIKTLSTNLAMQADNILAEFEHLKSRLKITSSQATYYGGLFISVVGVGAIIAPQIFVLKATIVAVVTVTGTISTIAGFGIAVKDLPENVIKSYLLNKINKNHESLSHAKFKLRISIALFRRNYNV